MIDRISSVHVNPCPAQRLRATGGALVASQSFQQTNCQQLRPFDARHRRQRIHYNTIN